MHGPEGARDAPERLGLPHPLERRDRALEEARHEPALRFEEVDDLGPDPDRCGGPPEGVGWLWDIAARIRARRGRVAPCPCHNDLLTSNFIDDGRNLRIVDWEYAGMGDPFFDLANFAVNHELGAEARTALLGAYFHDIPEDAAATLELMRFMSDFREAMWGVVQATISQLDFDYDGYAAEHFERLTRTANEAAFREALAE